MKEKNTSKAVSITERKTMDPLISVIVPYWNEEKWIGRCVDSLRMQPGDDFEFIFVDDNSIDDSKNIAKRHSEGDERFFFYNSECEDSLGGVSGARNTGLKYALGKWITFLDSDDEMNEDAYPRFMKMLEEDPRALIHQANHLRWYEKSGRLRQKYNNLQGKYKLDSLPQCWCMVWNKLYSAKLAKSVQFKDCMQYGEDELYNLNCLAELKRRSKEAYIHCSSELTMIKHFENKGSLAHTKGERELFDQAYALIDFIERNTDPEIRSAALDILSEHFSSPTYMKILCGRE